MTLSKNELLLKVAAGQLSVEEASKLLADMDKGNGNPQELKLKVGESGYLTLSGGASGYASFKVLPVKASALLTVLEHPEKVLDFIEDQAGDGRVTEQKKTFDDKKAGKVKEYSTYKVGPLVVDGKPESFMDRLQALRQRFPKAKPATATSNGKATAKAGK